jgi:hypothetical protein
MGLKPSINWAQATMSEGFARSDSANEHLFDKIGIFDTNWASHTRKVANTLKCLETNSFTVNPSKCAWSVLKTEWLGCHLMPTAYKPDYTKVTPFFNSPNRLHSQKTLAFHWLRQLILGILAASRPHQGPAIQSSANKQIFEEIKSMIASHVLLNHPDANNPYDIKPDASFSTI